MSRIILMENDKQPQSKCPHCKKPLLLNLDHWKQDMSKIVRSKCPLCGGEIFTALLVLAHGNPEGLANTIMNMAAVVDKDKQNFLG